jgi:nicotinamidase-related amidase
MGKKVHLLIIDPQNDFCTEQETILDRKTGVETVKRGSLVVPGAHNDMAVKLPNFIRKFNDKIEDIHVTLDSHHLVDIAHPIMWVDKDNNNPAPFTIVTHDDVNNGIWRAAVPTFQNKLLDYTKSLKVNNRYPLCIWPPHCIIGSWGAAILNELFEALLQWESQFAMVDVVTKGSNPFTEHYSAVQADVPDSSDPSTQLNVKLIRTLEQEADEIVIAGEALSHCVANTIRDIANNFADASAISKFVLLTDASSSVPGFENLGTDFIDEMVKRGMRVSTTDTYVI